MPHPSRRFSWAQTTQQILTSYRARAVMFHVEQLLRRLSAGTSRLLVRIPGLKLRPRRTCLAPALFLRMLPLLNVQPYLRAEAER
jgi:hypothetical protein